MPFLKTVTSSAVAPSAASICRIAFVAPLVANRFGRPQFAVACTAVLTIAGLLGVLIAPGQLALIWAMLLGIGTGGTFSVTLLLIASRAKDAVVAARLSSMAQGIGYMISAPGPLMAGLLHSVRGGWELPVIATIAIAGAQLATGLMAARPQVVER